MTNKSHYEKYDSGGEDEIHKFHFARSSPLICPLQTHRAAAVMKTMAKNLRDIVAAAVTESVAETARATTEAGRATCRGTALMAATSALNATSRETARTAAAAEAAAEDFNSHVRSVDIAAFNKIQVYRCIVD
ncbi:hypothetical protein L596_014854 [Steinernema carpocapsae]|nr:hypothetical protein L596_014854 [Steinernema carpocapsae]